MRCAARITRIEQQEGNEVCTGGMSGEKNLVRIAAIFRDVSFHPRDRHRRVSDMRGVRDGRREPVVDEHRYNPGLGEAFAHITAAPTCRPPGGRRRKAKRSRGADRAPGECRYPARSLPSAYAESGTYLISRTTRTCAIAVPGWTRIASPRTKEVAADRDSAICSSTCRVFVRVPHGNLVPHTASGSSGAAYRRLPSGCNRAPGVRLAWTTECGPMMCSTRALFVSR